MTQAITQPQMSLTNFLALPETTPPSEYINGQIIQKPLPKGKHSQLQWALVAAIKAIAKPEQIVLALPELRCTFGGRSIVPDVAVFKWDRVPFDENGEVPDVFALSPDWAIEILSPGQTSTQPTDNLLHSLRHETKIGWLIDPDERAVMVLLPGQLPEIKRGEDALAVLSGVPLELTVNDVFDWLRVGGR